MSRVFPFFVLCLYLLLPGCAADTQTLNQLRHAQAELRVVKEERDMHRGKTKGLYDELERSQRQWMDENFQLKSKIRELEEEKRQYGRLESRCDSLADRVRELEAWVKGLAEGYGPGIWTSSDMVRPLFVRPPKVPTVQGIIDELNERNREVNSPLLLLKKVEGRVVHVGVSDDGKLTAGMGSTGAAAYVQTALYSLTSLEEVDCVHFDIEEGDHAGPGTFCR